MYSIAWMNQFDIRDMSIEKQNLKKMLRCYKIEAQAKKMFIYKKQHVNDNGLAFYLFLSQAYS